jgi:hypothetical protein
MGVPRRVLIALATLVVLGGSASSAFAETAPPGYQGNAGGVQATVETGGTLPFTGLDLGLLIGGGLLMILVGVGLRRLSRSSA